MQTNKRNESMSSTPTFGTQVIGQTEKALGAILDRQLTGTGLTEPQWVSLNVALAGNGAVDRGQLSGRIAGVLKVSEPEAQARIAELVDARLLDAPDGTGSPARLTDAGRQLHARIRGAVTEITQRLWGDLPADDLATAGRVLSIALERANAELSEP